MESFWVKGRQEHDVIVRKVTGWFQTMDADLARRVERALNDNGIPWRQICGLFGGSPEAVPQDVIRVALDSFLLKIAILTVLADGNVSDEELQVAWPMTSELAASLSSCFGDLRGFNHRDKAGHCAFLDKFNNKDGWFGGQCEWTISAAALLVLYASIFEDAANPDQVEQRVLFLAFRQLTCDIARAIVLADGVSDAEVHLLEQIDRTFEQFLTSQEPMHDAPNTANGPAMSKSGRNQALSTSAQIKEPKLSRTEALDTALKELNALVGLDSVKKEVAKLTSFLQMQEQRKKQNLKSSAQTLHFVFKGNPGTGKTSVARILSKVFYGFGILESFKVVECDRSQLVAGYVGQTAAKTDEVITSALDGVLFIDEAYTLSKNSGSNDYGDEAINTLLKRMEDNRDRLIVVVAGYPKLMDDFISVNPGLESRFTRYITFEDYSVVELCQIFEKFAVEEEYVLTPECKAYLAALFSAAYLRRTDRFGNGRFVRNTFENVISLLSERLANGTDKVSKEELSTIQAEDVRQLAADASKLDRIDLSGARWRFACSDCGHSGEETIRFVGRRVKCKCGSRFDFPWWSLMPESVPGLAPKTDLGSNPFSQHC